MPIKPTQNGDLVTTFLFYALRCAQNGDQLTLEDMNVSAVELEAAKKLDVDEFRRIAELHSPCLEIKLRPNAFKAMLTRIHEASQTESLQEALMKAQAPVELMHLYFGLTKSEYCQLRRTLKLGSVRGRPPLVDEELEHKIWHLWIGSVGLDGHIPARAFLDIHRKTGVSIRAIWTLARRWPRQFLEVRPSQSQLF